MTIQVLGTGCSKCKALQDNVEKAVRELGLDAEVQKVTDLKEIMSYQVLSTPGLAVDGEVKVTGRVPSADEIKQILTAG